MKEFLIKLICAFFGAALATAVYAAVTNYIRFGYVPMEPMVAVPIAVGGFYAIIYALVHGVCRVPSSLISAIACAAAMLGIAIAFAISIGFFVGWSLLVIGAVALFSVLIGSATHFLITRF
jgi:hypothetical protein